MGGPPLIIIHKCDSGSLFCPTPKTETAEEGKDVFSQREGDTKTHLAGELG